MACLLDLLLRIPLLVDPTITLLALCVLAKTALIFRRWSIRSYAWTLGSSLFPAPCQLSLSPTMMTLCRPSLLLIQSTKAFAYIASANV